MRTTHCALIVEDQQRVASDLAEILRSIDCDTVMAHNKEDALRILDGGPPCLILLDLNIPRTARDIKGRTTVGVSFLQEVRQRYGNRHERKVWIPIIVISGHAGEWDQAVEIMKLEADDLIRKPYEESEVVHKVREALRKSGREQHSGCAAAGHISGGEGQVVEIPGTTVKNRTIVRIGDKEAQLTEESLAALLKLLGGHLRKTPVPLSEFGRDKQNAYKVLDRLRTALRAVVANPTDFVVNVSNSYSLSSDVRLGTINTARLTESRNATIATLARELVSIRQ